MAKRWALVKELSHGTAQRRIAEDLGLSLCKITRGSRELKKEGSAFKCCSSGWKGRNKLPSRRRARRACPSDEI